MTMKRHSILILAVLMLASCGKPAVEPLSLRMVRSEMSRCPDATWLDFCEGKVSWNYTPGLEMKAFLDVYQTYGGEDIVSYVDDWYGKCIEEDGHITYYYKGDYTVDKVCPARTLYQLYDITGKERYRFAVDSMMTRLSQHPRTSEGAFWHKTVYPHQIWLDGLYMAEPFYAEYVSRYSQDKAEGWADIINDFTVAARHTYDPVTKLYRHAWDESRSMFWCDPETGQSQHCWDGPWGGTAWPWWTSWSSSLKGLKAGETWWRYSGASWTCFPPSPIRRPACGTRCWTALEGRATTWKPPAPPCSAIPC